jgi:putative transcriptional regulator
MVKILKTGAQAMASRHKIVAGLREAISYAKDHPIRVRENRYNIPDNIDVKKLREELGMSQAEFALKFGFSLGTLRQWEQGRRYPDGAARVLLTVISHSPKVVKAALESMPPRKAAVG